MTRTYVDPKTGEIRDDVVVRPFADVLAELGEGSTHAEVSEALYDLIQRVQDTAKSGTLTLKLNVGFDSVGRLVIKDEVHTKLPEYSRPETRFFVDGTGNPSRRDPNQPMIPNLDDARIQRAATN